MFEFRILDSKKMLAFSMEGLLSIADAEKFNAHVRANIAKARMQLGSLRMLGDARNAPVKQMEISQILDPPSKYLVGRQDRYAIVVATTLHKLQVSRVIDDLRAKVFLAIEEAEEWLRAEGDAVLDSDPRSRRSAFAKIRRRRHSAEISSLLLSSEPPVHRNCRSGDEGRFITRQKSHNRSDLLGLCEPAKGMHRRPFGNVATALGHEVGTERSQDRAGTNRIHPDAERPLLERRSACEPDYAVL